MLARKRAEHHRQKINVHRYPYKITIIIAQTNVPDKIDICCELLLVLFYQQTIILTKLLYWRVTDTASNMVYAYSSSSSSLSSSSSSLGGQPLGRGIVPLIFTLGTILVVNVNAQSELCSTYIDSCNGCLENSCAWVPVAGCVESCDVIGADVSCYSSEDFTGITTEEICSKYMAMEASNIKLCHSQTDCTTCIDTTFADGGFDGTTDSCKWFHFDCCIESYCGHECGGMGCGAFTCDAVANVDDNDNNDPIIKNSECDSNMSCRNCLSTRQIGPTACGWVNGMGCVESCSNLIADVGGCYDIENFNGNGVVMTGDDICTVAENDLCSSQTDCTTCIETSRLGSSSYLDPYINTATAAAMKCRWFSNMNVCGSECNMIGCGETTCTAADSYNIGGDDDGDGISEATDNESDLIIIFIVGIVIAVIIILIPIVRQIVRCCKELL